MGNKIGTASASGEASWFQKIKALIGKRSRKWHQRPHCATRLVKNHSAQKRKQFTGKSYTAVGKHSKRAGRRTSDVRCKEKSTVRDVAASAEKNELPPREGCCPSIETPMSDTNATPFCRALSISTGPPSSFVMSISVVFVPS